MKNKEYQNWLNNAPKKVKNVISNYNDLETKKAFSKDLEFQTAGIRGVMGYGTSLFNEFTIIKATYGFARLLKSKIKSPKIAIGTDNRKNNTKFMKAAISVLNSFGIKTFYSKIQPTPFISFVTKSMELDGAIIVTASHNPKEYNGIKFYDSKGCQILPLVNEKIIAFSKEIENNLFEQKFKILKKLNKKIPTRERDKYVDSIAKMANQVDPNLKIVFGASNGTSGKIMNRIFRKIKVKIVNIKKQLKPNSKFNNTPYPNPEINQAFDQGKKIARKRKADAIFLVDPDADRFALAVLHRNNYKILTGNEIGILILYNIILENKNSKGYFVYSNVSTTMSKVFQKIFKIEAYTTLTGFKWIGNLIEKKGQENYLFGFEESNGCLINPNLARDKDSFQASVYVANMLSHLKRKNQTLVDYLEQIKKNYGFFESDTSTFNISSNWDTKLFIKNIIKKLKTMKIGYKNYYEEIGDMHSLLLEIFIDKQHLNLILIRPSGTEPKMKIYQHYYGKTRNELLENKKIMKNLLNKLV